MATKRKARAKPVKKPSRARAAPKPRAAKSGKTSALVRTSRRDREAAKSGVSKSRRTPAAGDGGASDRDYPDAVYEDDRRS